MADSENVDTTQQVTSKAPVTSVKNPKRVAAGKAIAEKRRQAREAQKQKIAEADIIIANERLKKAQEEAKKWMNPRQRQRCQIRRRQIKRQFHKL